MATFLRMLRSHEIVTKISVCVRVCVRMKEGGREGGRKTESAVESGLFPRMESAEAQDSTLSAEVH